MKLLELINELEVLLAEHGDLETVVADFGCGCCGGYEIPDPSFYEVEKFDSFGWHASHLEEPGTQVIKLN